MPDETLDSSSESATETSTETAKEESSKTGAETDISGTEDDSEAEKAGQIPYGRFKQVNTERKEALRVAKWYQENIGDPNDVVAFRKWQAEQKVAAEKTPEPGEEEKELTPKQIKAIQKAVSKAYPWMANVDPQVLQNALEKARVSEEVIYEQGEEEVAKLAKSAGMPQDEESLGNLQYHIGAEISRDPKLMKLFKAGDLSAIEKAFERYTGFLGKVHMTNPKTAATRRAVTKLPTAPAGSPTLTRASPEKRNKGLEGPAAKDAAEEAWAILNQQT